MTSQYGRVVLVIVGILTVQFCLFYIEHNTNIGEEMSRFVFFSMPVWDSLYVLTRVTSLSRRLREESSFLHSFYKWRWRLENIEPSTRKTCKGKQKKLSSWEVVNLRRLDVSSPTVLEQTIGASFPLRILTPSSSMGAIWTTTWMCVHVLILIGVREPVENIQVVQRIWEIGNCLLHLLKLVG